MADKTITTKLKAGDVVEINSTLGCSKGIVVPLDQLAEIYLRLSVLTRMGQATNEEWDAMHPTEKKIRHRIFGEAEFAAMYAGQWLPRDEREKAREQCRQTKH